MPTELEFILDLVEPLTPYFESVWIVLPLFAISVFVTILFGLAFDF